MTVKTWPKEGQCKKFEMLKHFRLQFRASGAAAGHCTGLPKRYAGLKQDSRSIRP